MSSENEKPTLPLIQKKWFRWSLLLLLVAVTFLVLSQYSFSTNTGNSIATHHESKSCKYRDDDPELFYLKTISGVHYDGGHWFHVAENFMVQHSLFRSRSSSTSKQGGEEAHAPEVYFLTDRGEDSLSISLSLSLSLSFSFSL
jgi:hypothetical protein